MIELELARSVLLERLVEANSREARFRKEWQAMRARKARYRDVPADEQPVDLFLRGEEYDRAA